MFQHGKAKEKKVELSEKQKKEIEDKLATIGLINKDILKKKHSENIEEKFDLKNLDYLYKAAKLMTDSNTIWNYRKEIILYIKEKELYTDEKFHEFMKEEVKRISALLLGNPKSYVLWNHREWILILASAYEIENNLYDTCLLKQDIALCNQFLMKDNRNFHCWNYRLSVVLLIKSKFPEKFDNLLKSEIDFTVDKIKESCSNFSAWHYRSKLLSIHFQKLQISWDSKEAFEYFEKIDFPFLIKAIYTDPRDQSQWNYLQWLINNLTPVICIETKHNEVENTIEIELSDILRIREVFNNQILINNHDILSSIVKIDMNKLKLLDNHTEENAILLKNYDSQSHNDLLSIENSLVNTNKTLSYTKNNLRMPFFTFTNGKLEYMNILNTWQIELLNRQIDFITKLIHESEGFLEFAHFRRAQIHHKLLLISNKEDNSRKDMIKKDYDLLIKNSKRQSLMYQDILDQLKL